MEFCAVIQGLIVGVFIAAPKGPAGFLVITQTVKFGFINGIQIAKGPIITTFISCGILIIISQWIVITADQVQQIRGNHIIHGIAGFFLFAVGVYIIYFLEEKPATAQKLFVYTLLEPMLFPGTIGTFIWINPDIFQQTFVTKLYFFLGIIMSTLFYYGISVFGFSCLSKKINHKKLRKVQTYFGVGFALLGLLIILCAGYKAVFL